MKNVFDLSNKIAIVTGGYGHLGTAMVKALADYGAKVIVAGRSEEKFNDKFKHLNSDTITFNKCDILDSESIEATFKRVIDAFGKIDIVINNAATLKGNDPENISDDDWSYSLDAVLGSVHKSLRAIIPIMKQQGFGKIINVSSMYGVVSPDFKLYEGENCERFLNPPHYGAAKAAMLQLTRYYATYLGKYNIHVNSITPGPFPSLPIQAEHPVFTARLKAKNPLGKVGTPEDLAGVCILLSSSASDFITGQNFVVDGGWTIQ
jgi:NAD(P)-dependent dehydrogenase (short-subunit alcohol dehydrogenase family)